MSFQNPVFIPGPTNIPEALHKACDMPTIDHRSPLFGQILHPARDGVRKVLKSENAEVFIFPSTGTGGRETALSNCLSAGDQILAARNGMFSHRWIDMCQRHGLEVQIVETPWGDGLPADLYAEILAADTQHQIKAVLATHNETATGVKSDIAAVRRALDAAGHPALLMVDTISSLASVEFKHDEWGVDVTVSGSQKGLMLPPGLSFNAISDKAMKASESAGLKRAYWSWAEMAGPNDTGYFPFTPATNLLYGLNEAIDMLHEEGLDNVFARHKRHGAATRAAVEAWGLEVLCQVPEHRSPVLTAVMVPEGHSADNFRAVTLRNYDMSLGNGLSKVADRVFRIGHLGDFNDLMLCGTLSGVEMGLRDAGIPYRAGGVQAALEVLGQKFDAARAAA
ncbi:aminotransferase class V-fold PLP-dependent enzyme [uncultured Roseovarius sp.]|uniref:pyridoxal-phosphate-dependent aminotransferase family protein n=1 Tax=uncultured Roseovarius sp. TaxID=293344 RepID=UPI002600B868|nr:aminotransferase class V-fold PLP-dependent enzyme [uncultured Roseovarius sp.]